MAVCIIGAGLAGLTLSIYLKLNKPNIKVVLIDNKRSGNTMVAGQRYRPLINKDKNKSEEVFLELLRQRNNNLITKEMKIFSTIAKQELEFWTRLNPKELGIDSFSLFWDQKDTWFGPQFGQPNRAGQGRGKNVLSWLQNLAINLDVKIINGTVTKLNTKDNIIDSINLNYKNDMYCINCDDFVLAGGNIGGSLFNSTNVPINFSPQELAYDAGIELVGGTINMFHILGNSNEKGEIKVGCYETDNLDNCKIYLYDKNSRDFTIYDEKTTKLLTDHQAHYHFKDIAKRFLEHGGLVRIVNSDNKIYYGRVSHHYSHLGIKTTDGTKIKGFFNLYAIGDASNTGYWSGFKVRYPGMALSNCLVTSKLVSESILNNNILKNNIKITKENSFDLDFNDFSILKNINTNSIMDIEFDLHDNVDKIKIWRANLKKIEKLMPKSTLLKISQNLTYAFEQNFYRNEPISICNVEFLDHAS